MNVEERRGEERDYRTRYLGDGQMRYSTSIYSWVGWRMDPEDGVGLRRASPCTGDGSSQGLSRSATDIWTQLRFKIPRPTRSYGVSLYCAPYCMLNY